MKHQLLTAFALLLACSSLAVADGTVSGSYTYWNAKAKDVGERTNLHGISLNYTPYDNAVWYLGGDLMGGSKYKAQYYEFNAGLKTPFVQAENYYVLGKAGVGIGYGSAKQDAVKYDSTFISTQLEIEGGVKVAPHFDLFASVGYRYAFDLDRNGSNCNDGTHSSSTGQGTCSWHGGVSSSSDNRLGDSYGAMAKVGVRYKF